MWPPKNDTDVPSELIPHQILLRVLKTLELSPSIGARARRQAQPACLPPFLILCVPHALINCAYVKERRPRRLGIPAHIIIVCMCTKRARHWIVVVGLDAGT